MSAVAELCYRDRVREAFRQAEVKTVRAAGAAVSATKTRSAYEFLLSCADYDTGQVDVGSTRLAKEAGMGPATAKRATSVLRTFGWLYLDRRGRKGVSVNRQYVRVGHPILPGQEPRQAEVHGLAVVPCAYWESVSPPDRGTGADYSDLWEEYERQAGSTPPF